jgi:hypothetical protein
VAALTQLYQLAASNGDFARCQRENASRINGARWQIACSVDQVPFFDDAGWRRLIRIMFLRSNRRFKDGKEHRYWNIVENKRCAGGKVVQRQVLYLGEINDGQFETWYHLIEAFDEGSQRHRQLALFPADREAPECADGYGVQVRLDAMELHRPRQWGACWLACQLYEQLELDRFWSARLPDSRKGRNGGTSCRRWCAIG